MRGLLAFATAVCRDISMGAVYATLDRLREKGLLSTRSGDPDPVRGARVGISDSNHWA